MAYFRSRGLEEGDRDLERDRDLELRREEEGKNFGKAPNASRPGAVWAGDHDRWVEVSLVVP